MAIDPATAKAEIERYIVPDLPDRANEAGASFGSTEVALIEQFGHRADRPAMRALKDSAESKVGVLLPCECHASIEVYREVLPALRHDRGETSACAIRLIAIDLGQQESELRGDAGTGLVLQRPFAQDCL